MKSFLVTGGAGFVGSHLAFAIKSNYPNSRVVVMDNLMRRGSETNLPKLAAQDIEFIHGDVRILSDLENCGKVDFVIECSAEPSVLAGSNGSPAYVLQTNLQGAINCAEYCRKTGAGLLFLSTSRVYSIETLTKCQFSKIGNRYELSSTQNVVGISAKGISENCSTNGFKSFYGASKFSAETVLEEYRQLFDWPIIINRCGLIAGPGQFGKADQGIISYWVKAHMEGRSLKYIGFDGSGSQVRDAMHVNDLAKLVLLQLSNPEKFQNGVYNVGGGRESSFSLAELTELCQKVTGCKVDVSSQSEDRYADIPIYISDNTKIQQICAWKIEFSVEHIVKDVYNCLQVQLPRY